MSTPASSLKLEKIYGLTGRVALVTGGGTGIGLMIAQGFAANGAKVYITGRRKEVLEKAAREWAGDGALVPLVMDVTDKESIMSARKLVETKDGRLHVLVNNAGQGGPISDFIDDPTAPECKDADTFGRALFANESIEDWASLFTINTSAIFFVTTAFLGLLDQGSKDRAGHTASVINISSICSYAKIALNHVSKHIDDPQAPRKPPPTHLTKMLATEFALKGIAVRVNGIAPGLFATEMTGLLDTEERLAKFAHALIPIPSKRAGMAQEVAGTAIYLASLAGCYTNGQDVVVDGSYLAVNPSTA